MMFGGWLGWGLRNHICNMVWYPLQEGAILEVVRLIEKQCESLTCAPFTGGWHRSDIHLQHGLTRFDYCNALLCGTREATLDNFRVFKISGESPLPTWRTADEGLLLRSLHWLPVKLSYKIALTAHKVRPQQRRRASATWYTLVRWHGHCSHPSLCKWSSLEPTLIWHDTISLSRLHLSCWTSTVPQHCYIQTTSVYPQLVTFHRCQHLCIFRLHGALQMLLLLSLSCSRRIIQSSTAAWHVMRLYVKILRPLVITVIIMVNVIIGEDCLCLGWLSVYHCPLVYNYTFSHIMCANLLLFLQEAIFVLYCVLYTGHVT